MNTEHALSTPNITDRVPAYKSWLCAICGLIYNERDGWPEEGIAAGTRWEDVSEDWVCPDCGAGKSDFQMTEI